MKKGLLIVNAFLNSESVRVTYDALLAGAARAGIEMELSVNSDYFVDMADGRVKCASPGVSARLADAGFILFWNKDVFLGRALERAGYRLFNSALGIEYCDNKALTFEKLDGIVDREMESLNERIDKIRKLIIEKKPEEAKPLMDALAKEAWSLCSACFQLIHRRQIPADQLQTAPTAFRWINSKYCLLKQPALKYPQRNG